MYLTKNELEIMDVLWENERPLSRGELMDLSNDKSWKNSSVHILLNSMLKKGSNKGSGLYQMRQDLRPDLCRRSFPLRNIISAPLAPQSSTRTP